MLGNGDIPTWGNAGEWGRYPLGGILVSGAVPTRWNSGEWGRSRLGEFWGVGTFPLGGLLGSGDVPAVEGVDGPGRGAWFRAGPET